MKRREKFYRAPPKRCPSSGKRCIPEEEVDHAVRALQTRNAGRAYWCEDCDSYHLTSMPLENALAWIRKVEDSDEETERPRRRN